MLLEEDAARKKYLGKLFVRLFLRCADPVELAYYSCKLNCHGVCCYCASDNASRPQNLLEKYFTVLPICEACKAVKPPVVRFKKKEN